MQKLILTATLFFLFKLIYAQQDISLPGEVVRQNSRVKTGKVELLSNVSIKATQATPTRSDINGKFTLVFSDKPAYNVTRVFAEKANMEIVNKTDLERTVVIGRLSKFKIVMCPPDELLENQMLYYGIARDAIVLRFKNRINTIEKTNTGLDKLIALVNEDFKLEVKTKDQAIFALEKEWSKALESAQEIAQKFAAINLDDADVLYLQAEAAYRKGDFDQVLSLLNYDLITKNISNIQSNLIAADSLSSKGRSRIAKGQESLRQTIENTLFAARVANFNGAYKKAEAYFDLAVKADESNNKTIYEVAHFMQTQNQFQKAKAYYQKILSQAKDLTIKAAVLNNLGLLLSDQNELIEAKKDYEEALLIRRKLAEKNPEIYLSDVAMILNNLANLLSDQNELTGAKKDYEEALLIYRELADKNPDVHVPDVAMILNNLGVLLMNQDELIDAKKVYEEALLVYRKLADKNPDTYLPYMATNLNNLALLLSDQDELIGAKKNYEEALLIRRKLADKNPDVYLPDVAASLSNLANLLSAQNELTGARKNYEEALLIYRKLADKNPDVYLPYVSGVLNNFGALLKDQNELIDAKKGYEEALLIRRKLAKKNPEAYLPDVAMTLNNLGLLLSDLNELADAKKDYEEALLIYRKLADKNPDVYLPYVATNLNNLGLLLSAQNELIDAKKDYEEALLIRRKLADKNPDVYLPDVATTLNNLADLLSHQNEVIGAKKDYEEALLIRRELADKNPDGYLQYVAATLNNLANLLRAQNEVINAKKCFEETLLIRRKLADKNPMAFNLDVVMTDLNVGLFYEALLEDSGEMALKNEGLKLMQDATERISIFPASHPKVALYQPYVEKLTSFFESFDETTFRLGKRLKPFRQLVMDLNESERDPHQKVLRQEEILALLFKIEKEFPDNPEVKKQIASNYSSLAWFQLFDQQFTNAEQSARAGLQKADQETWINTNLALALLYQGKWEDAKIIYIKLKDEPYGYGTYKDTFLEDLNALEKAGITHPDIQKARVFLNQKK